MRLPVPGWCADAGKPDNLIAAGLKSRHCAGVLALTNVDAANQQIAAATKLLRPEMTVIARAESRDAAISIAAYGTDHILDPYELFARIVKHALHAPSMYLLDERLTSVPDEPWTPPLHPPRGHWIVCGYGRVGQAIHGVLSGEGITCAIVEADPQLAARWPGAVLGTGIAADTLRQAGARDAQALIACTDNDANNLAVVFAARELNPDLFIVLRQNQRDNDAIVRAARVPLVLQRGSVLAGEVFSLVTSPLIVDFLRLAEQEDERWAEDLWRRIRAITGERNPDRWVVHVRSKDAPAISLAIAGGWSVRIRDLQRDPSNRDDAIPSVPLLLKRGRDFILLPAPDEALHKGDAVLFCGERAARRRMEWVTRNHNVFHYIYTGEERANRLLEKLALRKARAR
jgi:Trk K+ transport system NAD-binding subunit